MADQGGAGRFLQYAVVLVYGFIAQYVVLVALKAGFIIVGCLKICNVFNEFTLNSSINFAHLNYYHWLIRCETHIFSG